MKYCFINISTLVIIVFFQHLLGQNFCFVKKQKQQENKRTFGHLSTALDMASNFLKRQKAKLFADDP